MDKIAVVVLAAGNAKRLGKSKQLLPWSNSTLLGNVVKNVLAVDANKIFVVLGAYSNEIIEKINLSKTTILINTNWQQGLGSSIATVITEIDNKYSDVNAALLVLADQPFISSIHLNAMIKLHLTDKKSIIITRKEDYSGVPVLFPRKFFSELMLLSNDEGAKQIINRNKNYIKEIVCQDNTADIDTFEAYEALHKNV
ncbi:nucleotidyltransferase family protein [Flavobacterium salmonis]|uniref:Nicotine blue oxidoreductase n=1 Tax=Flavobacterium salmonis TaxID=2654844 RepID=A0A6V6YQ16_9FLAO|nr:nucleotidyltransferase family protein [Flavobacterium salmonis]CAD0000832.1 Nicotine blue oxidoreductase [Flavobacterium salmonis]